MGGGVPLSGVIGKAEVMDLPAVGNMSSTHSGNPLVCAAGLAVLEELENKKLISEAERKGDLLFNRLQALKDEFPNHIEYIFGKGLIAAILFKSEDRKIESNALTSSIAKRCMQKGLLVVHTGRESIKIGPPLCITDDALSEGVDVIRESVMEQCKL